MSIKITLGNDKELDGYDPAEIIALTFAEAKFNSISERGGTLSNRFGVEKTANNVRVLGLLDDSRDQSTVPYTKYQCKIEVDSMPIFYGFGIVEESSDRFYIRVFGDTAGFFDLIGDTLITELDLSAFDHEWTAANVHGRRQTTSGVVYPNINYGRWTGKTLTDRAHTDFFPAVYVFTLLAKAASAHDYTLTGTNQVNILPFSKKEFVNKNPANLAAKVSTSATKTYTNTQTIDTDTVDYDYRSRATLIGGDYVLEINEGGAMRAVVSANYGSVVGTGVLGLYDGSKFIDSITLNTADTGTYEFDGIVQGFASLQLRWSAGGGNSVDVGVDAYVEVVSGTEPIESGNLISIADNLPAIKVKDLFLQEAVEQNALIVVNSNANTIEFVPLDGINRRIPFAKDWSTKVDLTEEPKYEYRLSDYAQTNFLKWAEGIDEDPAYVADSDLGIGSVDISDGGLELLKTLYTSKFVASAIQPSFEGYQNLLIPRYSDPTLDYDESDIDPKFRICQVSVDNSFLVDITGQSSLSTQANCTFKSWADYITENYGTFQSVVDKLRLVEVLIRLNPNDIQELDITYPVYLLGDYWFIREVKQWKVNRIDSTIVKLIRL